MRVLEIINSAQIGGGGNHLLKLVTYLQAQGADVHVAISDDGPFVERFRSLGAALHLIPFMNSRFNLLRSGEILLLIRSLRPDLIHFHGTRAGFFGTIAKVVSNGIPTLYTVHGFSFRKDGARWSKFFNRLIEKFISSSMDRVITLSRLDEEEGRQYGIFRRGACVETIYNGVDPFFFSPARSGLSPFPEAPVIGTIARLVPQKGLDDFLRAGQRIIKNFPDASLLIAGSGPLEKDLRALASRLGIRSKVAFLGAREDVREVMNQIDIFVLSSHWEGLPYILLEALAMQKPVVATATSGAREVLVHGRHGLLAPPGDDAAIANAVEWLLRHDRKARAMARLGRQRVLKDFTEEKMLMKTKALYERVLKARGQLS